MGKCIVHMQKVNKGGLRGIQSHMNREHDSKTNPDIDKSKTELNYNIVRTDNLYQEVKQTIEDYLYTPKAIRKDAVHLCSFIVTSDNETMTAMSPETQRQFFADSVDFFKRRYGAEFLQYATVHHDETTPHLHIGIVPAVSCKDSDDMKLCAKELFTPKELRALQTAFYEQVGKKYGLERGEENSKRKHKSELDYKIQKQTEKSSELSSDINTLEQQKSLLQREIQLLQRVLKSEQETGQKTMSDWNERIAQAREKSEMVNKLKSLEQFIQHPQIAPLWQQFQQLQQQQRKKKIEKERY